MSFRRELQYLMQTETTKDVEDHCELTKEELILLIRRDSRAWRALRVLLCASDCEK